MVQSEEEKLQRGAHQYVWGDKTVLMWRDVVAGGRAVALPKDVVVSARMSFDGSAQVGNKTLMLASSTVLNSCEPSLEHHDLHEYEWRKKVVLKLQWSYRFGGEASCHFDVPNRSSDGKA